MPGLSEGNPYHRGSGPGGGQFTSKEEAGLGAAGAAEVSKFKRYSGSVEKIINEASKSFRMPTPTLKEKTAVEEYSGYGAYDLNEALRGKRRDFNLVPDTVIRSMTANLDSFVAKGQTLKDIQTYRGVTDEFAASLAELKPGDKITDPGFLSVSLKLKRMQTKYVKTAMMRVLLPKGSRAAFVAPISQNPTELEVILPRNSTLRYIGQAEEGDYFFKLQRRGEDADKKPELGAVISSGAKETKKPLGFADRIEKEFADTPRVPTTKPLSGVAKGSNPGIISARIISAPTKPIGNSDVKYFPASVEGMKDDPRLFAKNIALFRYGSAELAKDKKLFGKPDAKPFYLNLRPNDVKGSTETIAANVVDNLKENIKFLYNNATEEERSAVGWYRGARRLVDEHCSNYKNLIDGKKLNDASVAGVYAALSPNTDWDTNVYLADRVIDIYHTKQDQGWDDEMEKKANEIWSGNKKLIETLRNAKSLGSLTRAMDKAAWIRTYDEAHSKRNYYEFMPDGTLSKEFKRNLDGNLATAAWQSTENIAKAIISIEANGNRDIIGRAMGLRHKVRSFYNNILDPESENKDLTADTHAVGAAVMRPSPQAAVLHCMALGPDEDDRPTGWKAAGHSARSGVVGTYGVYADAYRAAAKELGLRPNELQAVVWTVKRHILAADDLSAKDIDHIDGLWSDYQSGKATLAKTRRSVLDYCRERERERNARRNARSR